MAVADAMSQEKRDALWQKFDEMDAEEALNALMSVDGEEPAQVTTASAGESEAVLIAFQR